MKHQIMKHRHPSTRSHQNQLGFTLLELIVVVTMVGILTAIAVPNLIQMPRRAEESVLKTNKKAIQKALDQHHADLGYYPESLDALVEEEYLREVPFDPMSGEREWKLVYENGDAETEVAVEVDVETGAGIIDVFSLSDEIALDGSPYSEW